MIDKEFDEIVYVGYETKLQHLLDRQKGFETSIKDSDTNIKAKYITVGLENISGEIHAEMEKTLGKNPTNSALYFSSNKAAVAGLEYLIKNNIKVPQQVSVLAFDETDAYKLFPAEITYVKQPLEEMADEAIKLLDLQITDYAATSKKITLSGELIMKKSIK